MLLFNRGAFCAGSVHGRVMRGHLSAAEQENRSVPGSTGSVVTGVKLMLSLFKVLGSTGSVDPKPKTEGGGRWIRQPLATLQARSSVVGVMQLASISRPSSAQRRRHRGEADVETFQGAGQRRQLGHMSVSFES